jgi:hypothetical protein
VLYLCERLLAVQTGYFHGKNQRRKRHAPGNKGSFNNGAHSNSATRSHAVLDWCVWVRE